MLSSKDFKYISIRGRVAFSICCLENALKKKGYIKDNWKFILHKLWDYTSRQYLDDWHMMMAEYTPTSILIDSYDKDECEYISYEEYIILKKLYQSTEAHINMIISHIFYMATLDLYGAVVNYSPNSLKELEKVLKIMYENHIELPDITLFYKFAFLETDGWGKNFVREEVFM